MIDLQHIHEDLNKERGEKMSNDDIKLTIKNLETVVNFVISQLEDEDGRGEYDEQSGVIGAITNAVGHVVENDNIKLDK